jgi:hypothetical protein
MQEALVAIVELLPLTIRSKLYLLGRILREMSRIMSRLVQFVNKPNQSIHVCRDCYNHFQFPHKHGILSALISLKAFPNRAGLTLYWSSSTNSQSMAILFPYHIHILLCLLRKYVWTKYTSFMGCQR